jgi:hypothetical protein
MKTERMKKHFKTHLALVLIAALLSGCTGTNETDLKLTLSNKMPSALTRDLNREASFNAKLYFVSEDERNLSPETRSIALSGSMSRAEAALRAMEDGPVSGVLLASVSETLCFSGIELSQDACNVYYTGSVADNKDWLILRAAVAATVYEAEGINAVNVFLNGIVPGYAGRPLGSLSPIPGALDTYLSELKQRYELMPQEITEAGGRESNIATLYFANMGNDFLIARNRKVAYDLSLSNADIVRLLLDELRQGDTGTESLEPVLPADLQLAQDPNIIYFNDPGLTPTPTQTPDSTTADDPEASPMPEEIVVKKDRDEPCVIELTFTEPAMEYDPNMMSGAITLMLTGYLPKVKGVKISIIKTADNGRKAAHNLSENEYFVRSDFADRIGFGIYLAFPDAESSVLDRVQRIVASASVYDPDARLFELFQGPADPGLMHPKEFTASDVLDVYIVDNLAVVNWKAGFAQKLEQLAQTQQTDTIHGDPEKLFIFGIVNTLTEIPGVERVWMLEDGQKIRAVADLYLGNALLRNPGILIDVATP